MKKCRFVPLCCLLLLVFASLTLAEDRLVIKDASDNTRFVCTDSGNVGIDQATPNYKLVVSANETTPAAMKSQLAFSPDGADYGGYITSVLPNNFWLSSGASFDGPGGGWIQKSADGKSIFAGSGGGGYRVYAQSGATQGGVVTPQERFKITYDGDVIIGGTAGGKLDVNGPIYQRGGVLHADYVFDKGHEVESIEDHSKFMWQNKHLKAVPGVTKDKNGREIVEVGAHQRGLLEELEKAHIYIEQLNKRLKQLEEKLNNQS